MALFVIEKLDVDDIPPYIFELATFDGWLSHIHGVIGFAPGWGERPRDRKALIGIGVARGLATGDLEYGKREALAAANENGALVDRFRKAFPFINYVPMAADEFQGPEEGRNWMFTMIAFLTKSEPQLTADELERTLVEYFRHSEGLSVTRDRLPTNDEDSLVLRWGEFRVRLSPETRGVREDAIETAEELGEDAPPGLANSSQWVRAVFGDDPDRMYTDHIIDLFEYLKHLPGAVLFDQQRRDIVT